MLGASKLARFLFLPELKLIAWKNESRAASRVEPFDVTDQICAKS